MLQARFIRLFILALCISTTAITARADVVDSSAQGFTSRNTLNIAAPPKAVYRHLTTDIGRWWDPEHTYSGASENLYIEPRAGGCFCEKLKVEGSIQHMAVVYVDPVKTIRMTGALGPLQQFAAIGTLTVSLTENSNGTSVEWTYTVGGYHPKGFQNFAPLVDKVLLLQLNRLKNYAETGKP
jgi:uncharacterized protein YndB with AHSA1/START domain